MDQAVKGYWPMIVNVLTSLTEKQRQNAFN